MWEDFEWESFVLKEFEQAPALITDAFLSHGRF